MTRIRKLTFATIASLAIATTALSPILVMAAQGTDPVVAASQTNGAKDDLRLSQDAVNTMRNIRAARIAIFNGDTATAKKLLAEAKSDLAKTRFDDTVIKGKGAEDPNKDMVPFDSQLLIDNEYIDTPEKAAHVKAGNEKLKQGNTKEALDELRLALVDVAYSRAMMPLDKTSANVDKAALLVDEGKFYEANIALKAAESDVEVETVMLVKAPSDETAATGADSGQKAAAPATSADKPAAANATN